MEGAELTVAARALGEDDHRSSVAQHREGGAHSGGVGVVTVERDLAGLAQEPAEEAGEHLELRQRVGHPRDVGGQQRSVDHADWLPAKITGPSFGTCSTPCRRTR